MSDRDAAPPVAPPESVSIAVCRDLCRRRADDFQFASVFLPRTKRDAACAVWAFRHMITDAMTPPAAPSDCADCSDDSSAERLELLNDRLTEMLDDRLELPRPEFRNSQQHVLAAAAATMRRYELPRSYFLDLAEACRLEQANRRYATWSALENYLRCSGGAEALLLCGVLGLTHSEAGRDADKLGRAVRLCAILASVGGDWRAERLYLPLEDLARFGYRERDLAGGVVDDRWRQLLAMEIDRTRKLLKEGAAALCWVAGDGSRLAMAVWTLAAAALLGKIERRNYDVFSVRPRLTASDRLGRIPAAWRLARRRAGAPMPAVF